MSRRFIRETRKSHFCASAPLTRRARQPARFPEATESAPQTRAPPRASRFGRRARTTGPPIGLDDVAMLVDRPGSARVASLGIVVAYVGSLYVWPARYRAPATPPG